LFEWLKHEVEMAFGFYLLDKREAVLRVTLFSGLIVD